MNNLKNPSDSFVIVRPLPPLSRATKAGFYLPEEIEERLIETGRSKRVERSTMKA
jgi:hypothetical protein